MALILNIETATPVCSVALAKDGEVLMYVDREEANAHSALLASLIKELFDKCGLEMSAVDAIAVSMGPGSYTGLRIGVSTAKGLCYALDKPLIAVGTLEIMANGAIGTQSDKDILFCPMIDARRMEVYAGIYNKNLECVMPVKAEIIDENSFSEYLSQSKVLFFGNGADKCKEALAANENAMFGDYHFNSSRFMVSLAEEHFKKSEFVDVAYFEPFYLKDFVATTPKNKVLGDRGV